jgi:glycosyltransferase involved in cell wall biosynthesis
LFGQLRALRAELDRSPERCVVANSMRGALLAALTKPKDVLLLYWVRDGMVTSSMSRLKVALTRHLTLRRVDGCLANSDWTAGTVRAVAPGLPVRVAPSPSGVTSQPMRTGRRIDGNPGGCIPLLFIGRTTRWKGCHVAIAALERLTHLDPAHHYRLTIAGGSHFGEHQYLKELQQHIERSPGDITFLGHVEDISALLSRHDFLLHCSLVPEPFGQVVVQGMAAGLVTIATAGGGPSEIIEDGADGLLYRGGDDAALAAAVARIAAAPDRYARLSAAAIEKSRQYEDAAVVGRIDAALGELLAQIGTDQIGTDRIGTDQIGTDAA